MTDTSKEADAIQLKVIRKLGPERRSQLAAQWSDAIREIALQGIRDRHDGCDERQVVLEYARITLGKRLFQEAFAAETTNLA